MKEEKVATMMNCENIQKFVEMRRNNHFEDVEFQTWRQS